MKDGYQVIDADRHIMEPIDLGERVEAPFKGRVTCTGPGWTGWYIDGKSVSAPPNTEIKFPFNPRWREVFADGLAEKFSPAVNLRDMDREGVDVAVHFPTAGLLLIWQEGIEPALSAAVCRAYNNWLAEYCSHDPVRLKGVAMIPMQDPPEAARELRRAVEQLGFVGAFMRPNRLEGRLLNDPAYEPIYREAEELGVPITLHEGATTTVAQAASDRYTSFGRHIACHPLEQMMACLYFCGDGLLERYPRLKIAYLESGAGWLPFWLERMDDHWENEGQRARRQFPDAPKPSELFKRQCMISGEAGEEMLSCVVEHVGDEYIIMATDYPHGDAVAKFPERTVGALTRNPHLSAESKRKILWDNPARLYGIHSLEKSAVMA